MTPELLAKMNAARAARDPRCTDETGATWRTVEKRQYMDDLRTWQAAGMPKAGAADLDARKAALKRADLW